MKKILFALLLPLMAASCASVNVLGLYHSDDCSDDSENCFQYNFHDDGSFTYWYTNATFGDFFVTGNYYVIGKKLKLFPIRYIFHDTTSVKYTGRSCNDSLHIKVSLLPGFLKNRQDTMQVPWLIRINDAAFFDETDEYGSYSTAADSITKIEIKEYSAKYYMDSEMPEADTVIYPVFKDRDIHIMLASSVLEPLIIPPVHLFKIYRKGAYLESQDTMDMGYWQHTTRGYVR